MSYTVGLRTLFFADATRSNWDGNAPRPLLTDVWYPATSDAQETPILLGPPEGAIFQAGNAARDAAIIDSPEQFPLILISHGTGGATLQLGWLASVLAAHGYIVAGVNHHGNTAVEPYTAQGFARLWERPQDLTIMLDHLLDDPTIGRRIDRERIGVAGFSAGGYTAIALAGGMIDLHTLIQAFEESGRPLELLIPPEFQDTPALVALIETLANEDTSHRQSYRDRRVRAAFAIAPALGEAFTAMEPESNDIPIKIVVGAADTNTPPALNAMRYASLIKQAELVMLEGQVGHYTFLAEGTVLGKQILPELCSDHPSVDRSAIHQRVSLQAVEFFDRHLSGGL